MKKYPDTHVQIINPDDAPESIRRWVMAFGRVAGITDVLALYDCSVGGLVQFFFYHNGQSTNLDIARSAVEDMNTNEIESYLEQRLIQVN